MERFDFLDTIEVRIAIKVSWRLHSLTKAQLRLPASKNFPILYEYLLTKFESTPNVTDKVDTLKSLKLNVPDWTPGVEPCAETKSSRRCHLERDSRYIPDHAFRYHTKNYILSKHNPNSCFFVVKET